MQNTYQLRPPLAPVRRTAKPHSRAFFRYRPPTPRKPVPTGLSREELRKIVAEQLG
jgi:hypothetical protein